MTEFSVWDLFATAVGTVPERVAVRSSVGATTFRELHERVGRIASYLVRQGWGFFGVPGTRRDAIAQPLVGIMAADSERFIEVLYGCFRARAVPFTINFRYGVRELVGILGDAQPVAVFVADDLVPVVQQALGELGAAGRAVRIVALGERDDAAVTPYRACLSSPAATLPECTPEDRYLLYTGGTTGSPKGTIWRQADIAVACLGAVRHDRSEYRDADQLAEDIAARPAQRVLSAAPMMHGLGQWNCLRALDQGMTVVLAPQSRSFDPAAVIRTCAREQVSTLVIAGDAFARPLLERLESTGERLPAMQQIVTGSVHLSPTVKRRLAQAVPTASIVEGVGGSETGGQMTTLTPPAGAVPEVTTFVARPNVVLLDDERRRLLGADEDGSGWLASRDRIPLGYLNDPVKTASLFTEVDGVEYVVNGDRAAWAANGEIRLIGRGSLVINTGGEKVFAEEVEAALLAAAGVQDALVCGLPDPRWGSRVVALVVLATTSTATEETLRTAVRAVLADYKVPKQIVVVGAIVRSPAGKADYSWARETLNRHLEVTSV